jgi:hypothetical protein
MNEQRGLAEVIATRLFMNGNGDVATRLELRQGETVATERPLGGWAFKPAVDMIEQTLRLYR